MDHHDVLHQTRPYEKLLATLVTLGLGAGRGGGVADGPVPFEAVCSSETLTAGLTGEGWGEVHPGVAEEQLLAGECLEAGGARLWILVHLHYMFVELVLGRKCLGE